MVDDADGGTEGPLKRLETRIADLLASGHGVLGGAAVAVRLRTTDVVGPDVAPSGASETDAGARAAADGAGEPQERFSLVGWPSDSAAVTLLRTEELAGGGPALDAARNCSTVDSGDLSSTQLWPAITAAALEAGVCSVLAVPVLDGSVCVGSLIRYGSEPRGPADTVDTVTLAALACHLAVLLANATAVSSLNRTIAQLRDAMLSRGVIEQAKGVLIAREKIDADTAWEYLVRISQRTHRKLRDISADIVRKASSGSL